MTLVHSPEALRAGPLAGHMVQFLTPERSVVLDGDVLAVVSDTSPEDGEVSLVSSEPGWIAAEDLTYIGERQDDGFIAAPEGGWESNPVPGRMVEVRRRYREEGGMPHYGLSYASDTIARGWVHLPEGRGRGGDIIAFRLAGEAVSIPEGEEGALRPAGFVPAGGKSQSEGLLLALNKIDQLATEFIVPECDRDDVDTLLGDICEAARTAIHGATAAPEGPSVGTKDEVRSALNPVVWPRAGDDARWDAVDDAWRKHSDEVCDEDGRIDITELHVVTGIAIHEAFRQAHSAPPSVVGASEPVACPGCEGKPAPENNPCAVCGLTAQPLEAENRSLREALEEARTLDKGFYEWLIERDLITRGDEIEWADIVTALTEHEIEISREQAQ